MSEKMVIFDCDGVLVDSEILATRVDMELLAPYGLDMTTQEYIATFVGQSHKFFHDELTRRIGQPLPDSFNNAWDVMMKQTFIDELQAVRGIPGLLDTLKVKKSIGSNSNIERIKLSLEITKIDHHFDGGVYSSKMVPNGKPAPDIYLFAASQNNIDPANCVVVEDSFYGASAGKAAGMHVIGFGAGQHVLDNHRDKMHEANIDAYAATADELLPLITSALSQ